MSLYASDVLEPLLDAGAVRSAVREHCVRLLDHADPGLRNRLMPAARYVGGKCMGYPAIWFLERMLGPRGISLGGIIERSEPALSVSLTTSIVDDLVDRDESIIAEYVAFLYVLIAHAAFEAPTAPRTDLRPQRALLDRALDVCMDPNAAGGSAARRGNRIGHFYRMIAHGPADAFLPEQAASVVVEAVGRFGEFCAHVDDWIDMERDLERGVNENVALSLLRSLRKAHASAKRIDLHAVDSLTSEMGEFLKGQLHEIRSMLAPLDVPRALESLERIAVQLPGSLLACTARAHDNFHAVPNALATGIRQIIFD